MHESPFVFVEYEVRPFVAPFILLCSLRTNIAIVRLFETETGLP